MAARHESVLEPWNSTDVARSGKEKPTIIEVDVNEIEEIIAATESGPLSPEQREKLLATVRLLFEQIRSGKAKRKDSEKLERVLNALAKEKNAAGAALKDKEKKPGHGRNGAAKFAGAEVVEVKHPELSKGDKCPACLPEKPGKVYPQSEAVTASVQEAQRGDSPGRDVAQWEILKKAADSLKVVLKEMLSQAAQGDVLHNDDTSMKILKIERPPEDTRTGIFTSTVVSTSTDDKPRIALFFTGWQHAGENLRDVLELRRDGLETPTRMGDAASKNCPKDDAGRPMDADKANCLAHGRCYIVDAYKDFPEECRHILEELSIVFLTDKKAKEDKLDSQQRLEYHQAHSGPVMDRLKIWMDLQLTERKVEPNSVLGVAIRHLAKTGSR